MKLKILALFLLFTIHNYGQSLNNKIYKCQKKFDLGSDGKNQLKRREQYINDIVQLRAENENDTIVISESYGVICSGCPANVNVFTTTKHQRYIQINDGNRFTKYSPEPIQSLNGFSSYNKDISAPYLNYDLKMILSGIRSGKSLEKITAENNTEECYDGSVTIYTLIFPNGKLECMRIRCWNNDGY